MAFLGLRTLWVLLLLYSNTNPYLLSPMGRNLLSLNLNKALQYGLKYKKDLFLNRILLAEYVTP